MSQLQRYRMENGSAVFEHPEGNWVTYANHLADRAELVRLLKVFYEASTHYQNEDGNCDCEDCDKVKEILEGA